MTTHEVVSKLGLREIAAEVGVTVSAVREARRSGMFPSAWFLVMRDMAKSSGVDLPESLFSWKAAS